MKHILLSTAALTGLVLAGAPVSAQEPALQLGVSGYATGYGIYTGGDDLQNQRRFDFRKHSEVYLSGEVALDNGITAGAHFELQTDRADNNAQNIIQESYIYLSSSWGRVNLGEEDGAAYLLQVAAPSADSNIDGLRPVIGTVGLARLGGYSQDEFRYSNKLTYLTPVFSGFQVGASYVPTVQTPEHVLNMTALGLGLAVANSLITPAQAGAVMGYLNASSNTDLGGLAPAVVKGPDAFQNGLELAARYEGSFNNVDVTLGAGYSTASLEQKSASIVFDDSLKVWNVGANIGIGGFGFGAAYMHSNNAIKDDADYRVVVLGADYQTGPYTFGLSYKNAKQELFIPNVDMKAQQWTVGGVYEWAPGMSLRGSVQYVDAKVTNFGSRDRVQFALGTQINF